MYNITGTSHAFDRDDKIKNLPQWLQFASIQGPYEVYNSINNMLRSKSLSLIVTSARV